MVNRIRTFPLEGVIWTTALIALFLYSPGTDPHLTLCPLNLAGFENCPGCGLGRSVSMAMKGEFAASMDLHILGIPALGIILYRIYQLIVQFRAEQHGKSNRITS